MRELEYQDRDEDFIVQYEERLIEFVESDDEKLALEPMNSYYRRLVHNLALRFNLKSSSEGGDRDRHVVVVKTEKAAVPERVQRKSPVVWNFGDREFLVDPLAEEVEVFLAKDGSVGIYDDGVKDVIAKKKIQTGAFKIKMNKIVELSDKEW